MLLYAFSRRTRAHHTRKSAKYVIVYCSADNLFIAMYDEVSKNHTYLSHELIKQTSHFKQVQLKKPNNCT